MSKPKGTIQVPEHLKYIYEKRAFLTKGQALLFDKFKKKAGFRSDSACLRFVIELAIKTQSDTLDGKE